MALWWTLAALAVFFFFFARPLLQSALHWFKVIVLSTVLAIVGGMLAVSFVPTGDEDGWIPFVVTLPVFALSFLIIARLPVPAVEDRKVVAPELPPIPKRPTPWAFSRDPWDRLIAVMPESAARISVVRESMKRASRWCEGRSLDLEAMEVQRMANRHVPTLIRQDLAEAREMPEERGSRRLTELIDLLERVAADCERRVAEASSHEPASEDRLRQHVERFASRRTDDPFA